LISRFNQAFTDRLDRFGADYPTATGIALVVAASAFFACMHASVRYVSADMHPWEVGFFRNLFGFLVFAPVMMRSGIALLRTDRLMLHVVRGSLNGVSMLCWFYALAVMPLADATSVSLTGPLFVTLGAIVILGEKVRARRWVALGAGVVGTLIIIRPGVEEMSTGALLVLASGFLVAGSKLIAKTLARTDGTMTIVAYLSLVMTIVTFIPAMFVWRTPTLVELGWLALIGALGSTGHLLVIRAYKYADVSAVEPVTFSRLVFAAIAGYLAFGEIPDIWIWVGGGIIVAATSYIAHRETVAEKARKASGESDR
jgi:drug/metabolite transporter (DMT)-like permease